MGSGNEAFFGPPTVLLKCTSIECIVAPSLGLSDPNSGSGCFLGLPMGLFGSDCPGEDFGGLPLGLFGGVSSRGYFLGLPLGRFGGVSPRGTLRGLPLGRAPDMLWLRSPGFFGTTSPCAGPMLGGESTETADDGLASNLGVALVAVGSPDARRRQMKVSKSRYHSPVFSSRSVVSAGTLSSSPSTTSSDASRPLTAIVLLRLNAEGDAGADRCVSVCRLFIEGCPIFELWGSRAVVAGRSTLTLFALAAANTCAGSRTFDRVAGCESNGVRLWSRKLAAIAALKAAAWARAFVVYEGDVELIVRFLLASTVPSDEARCRLSVRKA